MRSRIAIPLILATSFGLVTGTVRAQVKSGAWEMQCSQPAGSVREHCVLSQAIAGEEKPDVGIGVIIIKRADAKDGIIQVIAPLNVLLPYGVSLKIDQSVITHLPFYRCFKAGCRAETAIDERLLEQLNNGNQAIIVIHMDPSQGVRHLMTLRGFKEAYEKLK